MNVWMPIIMFESSRELVATAFDISDSAKNDPFWNARRRPLLPPQLGGRGQAMDAVAGNGRSEVLRTRRNPNG